MPRSRPAKKAKSTHVAEGQNPLQAPAPSPPPPPAQPAQQPTIPLPPQQIRPRPVLSSFLYTSPSYWDPMINEQFRARAQVLAQAQSSSLRPVQMPAPAAWDLPVPRNQPFDQRAYYPVPRVDREPIRRRYQGWETRVMQFEIGCDESWGWEACERGLTFIQFDFRN